MQRYLIRLIVSFATFMIGVTAAAPWSSLHHTSHVSGKAEQEILEMERQYFDAHTQRDSAALDRLLADDFTFTYSGGRVVDKAYRLAMVESPELTFLSINTDDVTVRLNGDKASVTGQARVRGRYQGRGFVSPLYRFERSYEKQEGRWQIVATRATRIVWQ